MNSNENMSAESIDISNSRPAYIIEAPSDPAELNICIDCQ
jgi:hypothetical protein